MSSIASRWPWLRLLTPRTWMQSSKRLRADHISANTAHADSDESLFLRHGKGDWKAYVQLYHRHKGAVHRYFLHLTTSMSMTERLSVRTWVDLAENRHRFQPGSNFKVWLFEIAHHHWLLELKQQHRAWLLAMADPVVVPDPGLGLEDPSNTDVAWAVEVHARLRQALLRLPLPVREAFMLYQEGNLDLEEAAEVSGISLSTAKNRLKEAFARILAIMAQRGDNLSQAEISLLYRDIALELPSSTLDQQLLRQVRISEHPLLQGSLNLLRYKHVWLSAAITVLVAMGLLMPRPHNQQVKIVYDSSLPLPHSASPARPAPVQPLHQPPVQAPVTPEAVLAEMAQATWVLAEHPYLDNSALLANADTNNEDLAPDTAAETMPPPPVAKTTGKASGLKTGPSKNDNAATSNDEHYQEALTPVRPAGSAPEREPHSDSTPVLADPKPSAEGKAPAETKVLSDPKSGDTTSKPLSDP